MFLPRRVLEEKLRAMLTDDLGEGDVTTALVVTAGAVAEAEVRCKEAGVAAGIEEAKVFLESLGLKAEALVEDGGEMKKDQVMLKVSGNARTLLSSERTLLNLLSRMSGIATSTRQLVKEIQRAKLKIRVACTRKTAPGLLYFDKKAVLVGGGDSHRLHLDDLILIKDNHIMMSGSLRSAILNAKRNASFSKKIEVEVTSSDEALEAAEAGVDIIMLDNFSPKQIEKTVEDLERTGLRGNVLLEASGGINSENFMNFASKRVDIISLGEITESAKTLDINMKICHVLNK